MKFFIKLFVVVTDRLTELHLGRGLKLYINIINLS